jgi:hypothetical protein
MSERLTNITPIAEYRGVAICDIRGSVKQIWKGETYWTDGYFYILRNCGQEVETTAIPTEKEAKDYIESLPDTNGYLSFFDVLDVAKAPQDLIDRIRAENRVYLWSEEEVCFVWRSGIRDGHHRWRGFSNN